MKMNRNTIFLAAISTVALTAACRPADNEFLNAAGKNGHKIDINRMKALVERGADVNAQDEFNQTALFFMADNPNMLKWLLDRGANPNVVTEKGYSVLHLAASRGDLDIIRLCLNRGADVNLAKEGTVNLKKKRYYIEHSGPTALDIALKEKKTAAAKVLIEHGGDIRAWDRRNGWTALHRAVEADDISIAKLLLSRGAAVNAQAVRGKTPITMTKNPAMISLLKSHGAKDGYRALHTMFMNAIRSIDYVQIKKSLDRGLDVNAPDGNFETGLLKTNDVSRNRIAALLIARGADVHARDGWGRTPLHRTARFNNPFLIKLLLKTGARVNAKDIKGDTALLTASRYGSVETLKLLLAADADTTLRDRKGRTALHIAAHGPAGTARGQLEMIRILLAKGLDAKAKDNQGRIPLDLVKSIDPAVEDKIKKLLGAP